MHSARSNRKPRLSEPARWTILPTKTRTERPGAKPRVYREPNHLHTIDRTGRKHAMLISRAGFMRGLIASTALPLTARAAPGHIDDTGAFSPDNHIDGAKPWTGMPHTGAAALRFAVIGDNTGLARPGVFDQAMQQISWL